MVKAQIILFWAGVAGYAIATALYIASLIFKKDNWVNKATIFGLLGFLPHTAAIGLRTYQIGHFPYWGVYEVFTAYSWSAVLFFLIVQFLRPGLRITGALVFPLAFLMIGIGLFNDPTVVEAPPTFLTFWLWVHIAFAKLSYASALVSSGLGLCYIIKENQELKGRVSLFFQKLPALDQIDYLSYRFAAFAFVMLGIMILSGAIWAYKAWGRYWGWDPIETWALIGWLVYGIYLHLRITLSWKGRKAAWMAVVALLTIIFAFFGIPLFYPSVHEHLEYKKTGYILDYYSYLTGRYLG